MSNRITATEYAKKLARLDNVLILIHSHPDGDTLGTGCALLNVLCELGKKAVLACTDEIPHHIEFVTRYTDITKCRFGNVLEDEFSPDAVVSCDIASNQLIGSTLKKYGERIVLALDHHEINTLLCDDLFVEPNSSSAGETMYFAIKELEKVTGKKLITRNTACALYSAICSDSGCFKFSSVGARTMLAAGELISLGAENAEIARRLFDIRSLDSFRAESICVNNTKLFCDGKIAFSSIDLGTYEKYSLCEEDFDTCVQILRMIEGAEVGIFMKEKRPDAEGNRVFRFSFRSNDYVDVSELCATFGGGGHKKAAGCTIVGDFDEVVSKVITETEKRIKN